MTETQHNYLSLREGWSALCAAVKSGRRTQEDKDDLFGQLSRLWASMTQDERQFVGTKCVARFHF